jgi:S-adenosylmethionine synthetase
MKPDYIFTSVSVTSGHPDKLCDSISDAILDAYLMQDPAARVAAECALASGVLFLSTRVHSDAGIDQAEIARQVVESAGYTQGDFNAEKCSVMINHGELQRYAFPRMILDAVGEVDIDSVPASHSITLFGYACRQSASLMPLPVVIAHRLARRLETFLARDDHQRLSTDGQVHVSVAYTQRKPIGIHSVNILISQQAHQAAETRQLHQELIESVVQPVLADPALCGSLEPSIVINPAGAFNGRGPIFHSGLTGRKTGIDTYGEYARNCSAALSGKDPLRIDRIGVYAARQAAKHVVAAGLAEECEVLLSYAAGQSQPVSVRTHTYGTGLLPDVEITQLISDAFDFRPGALAAVYQLQQLPRKRKGFYRQLAVYGHLGREDLDTPWERLDRLDAFQQHLRVNA